MSRSFTLLPQAQSKASPQALSAHRIGQTLVSAAMENLEGRQLMSASIEVVGGTLVMTADPATASHMYVGIRDHGSELVANINGMPRQHIPLDNVSTIQITGSSKSDRIVVGRHVSLPVDVNGGEGNNVLLGGGGTESLTAGNGNNYINGRNGTTVISAGTGNNVITAGSGQGIVDSTTGMQVVHSDRSLERVYRGPDLSNVSSTYTRGRYHLPFGVGDAHANDSGSTSTVSAGSDNSGTPSTTPVSGTTTTGSTVAPGSGTTAATTTPGTGADNTTGSTATSSTAGSATTPSGTTPTTSSGTDGTSPTVLSSGTIDYGSNPPGGTGTTGSGTGNTGSGTVTTTPASGPSTTPGGSTPGTGTSGTPTTTPQPPTDGSQPVLPANWQTLPNISTLFPNGITAGMTIDLGGQTYLLNKQLTVTVPGVTIQNGMIVEQTASGYDSGVASTVAGTGLTITGVDFVSTAAYGGQSKVGLNAIRVSGANLTVNNCRFSSFDDGIFMDQPASNFTIQSPKFFDMRGDSVYVGGAATGVIDSMTCTGSTREHCIRIDTGAVFGSANTAGGILINNCDLTNNDGKECIAIRNAGGSVNGVFLGTKIVGGTLTDMKYGGIRVGNVAPAGYAAPVNDAPDVSIIGVTFNTGATSAIYFDEGTDGWVVDSCSFPGVGGSPIGLTGAGCAGTMTNCIIRTGGAKFDGRLVVANSVTADDYPTISGTVTDTGDPVDLALAGTTGPGGRLYVADGVEVG